MNCLIPDCIAIDTNVIEHLFNPEMNTEGHITSFITHLFKEFEGAPPAHEKKIFLVDDGDRIFNEYNQRLKRRLEKLGDKQKEGGAERTLASWIINPCFHFKVPIKNHPELMRIIERYAPREQPNNDKYFVYVAFAKGRTLVTNDPGILKNAVKLRNSTKRARRKIHRNEDQSGILCSSSAEARTRGQNKRRNK